MSNGLQTPRVGIIGAGPVGLAAAILLRQQGVDVALFEKRSGPCLYPQAHVINTRTSEILREMGLYDRIAAAAAPSDKVRYVTWSQSLTGRRFGRLPYQGESDGLELRRRSSPVQTLNIGQDRFEGILSRHLTASGGDILYGHEVLRVDARVGGVDMVVRGPDGVEFTRRYDYLLACDGANSMVRETVGIAMEGPPSLARFASAYFQADLGRYLGTDIGPVHFIAGPEVRGVIIGFDLATTWAFMCVIPPDAPPSDFTADVMRELILRAVGDPDMPLTVTSVGSWNMSAQVAGHFRKDRVFLLGDAAHRFPPTGGLGLNTGVQDAHNLAWKLAMHLRGEAGEVLLDSYEAERHPVACRNRDHSVSNAMKMAEVDAAIGWPCLTPVDPKLVTLPRPVSSPIEEIGTDWQRAIDLAIRDQRPHFDALDLELGFIYGKKTGEAVRGQTFVPRIAVGARLPHAPLNGPGEVTSSLDMCNRKGFTLLLRGQQADRWTKALALWEGRGPSLTIVRLDDCCPAVDGFAFEGAVLVRPDGHVLWQAPAAENPQATIQVIQEFAGNISSASVTSPHVPESDQEHAPIIEETG